MQGAGAPTMFQAMRRIIDCLASQYIREGIFERAIRQSFLGKQQALRNFILLFILQINVGYSVAYLSVSFPWKICIHINQQFN